VTLYLADPENDHNIGSMTQTRKGPKVTPYDDSPKVESLTVSAFVSNYDDQLAMVGVSTHYEGEDAPEQLTFYVNAKAAAELAQLFARIAGQVS
jgi:hypothetical protein